ncbi:unnamed protein product [Mytilus coruscus]|uniref:Uncharacterized protein n=1 Tax=Mytilus coruscus TaxID=42192 RepID=A0A6J8CDA3_MYTCO|nr:unnamed protein product [Mytilus coruscus]
MEFKPKKSRALVIRKGKSTHQVELKVQGKVIPSIIDNPITYLGKWFDDSLSDKNNIRRIEQKVSEGIRNIDKTGTVAVGRQGFGTSKSCYWKNANTQERRSLDQREIKYRIEENRQAKTVELGSLVKMGIRTTTPNMVRNMALFSIPTTVHSEIRVRCVTNTYKSAQVEPFRNTRLPLVWKQRNSTCSFRMQYRSNTRKIYLATQSSTPGTS